MRSALRPLIAPYTALALAMPLLSGCSGPSTAVPGDPSAEVGDEPAEVGDVETLQQNLLTLAIDEAFVWAPSPTPAPLPRWSYNSENGGNSVTVLGTGRYRVDFGNLYSPDGNAQVSSYGVTNARCKAESWAATSASGGVSLTVVCHGPTGSVKDSSFVASYMGGSANATYAHLLTKYGDRDHTAPTATSKNSAAQPNVIDRTGTGLYSVTLTGLNTGTGDVQVTAYGTDSRYCHTDWWNQVGKDTVVRVRCFDTSGALADSRFSLRYMTTQAGYPGRSDLAYAWADDSTRTTSYQPNSGYAFNSLPGQPAISAIRRSKGKYSMTFPGMPLAKTTAMVTGYGVGAAHCHPEGWAGTETSATGPGISTTLDVGCVDTAGNPVDSQFTAAFLHSQPTTQGYVSTTTNTTVNRCADGSVDDMLDNLDSFPHTEVAYDPREGTVLPPTGDSIPFPANEPIHDHVQGIGRLSGPAGKNWIAMTIRDESQGGMFFVETGQANGNGGEAFNAGKCTDTSKNRNRAYYPLNSHHPGGLQVIGTGIAATVGPSRDKDEPLVFFLNVFNPTGHTFSSEVAIETINLWTQVAYPSGVPLPPSGDKPAGVGLVRLASGDYLMAVAGESTSATRTMWLYLSDSPSITSSTKWFFHNYLEYTIAHGAENVNFVTQCDGAVRLLHTSNPKTATLQVALQKENGVTNDITSTPLARQADGKLTVAFTDFSFSRGVFQNDEFCDFRSAANPYVTPSGKLVLYCASRGAFPDLNYRFGEIP